MRLISKMLFGAAALVTATAASFPHGFGDMYLGSTYPRDLRKQQALKLCQQERMSFVAFLASDRSAYTTGTIVTIDGGAAHRGAVM